jgi:hypothetical protein
LGRIAEQGMSTPPYTEREWNHLIRQGDPEGWQELGGDLAFWKPKVERICARHGLSIHGEMQWSSSGATVRCSNTGFLIGDVAVKLYRSGGCGSRPRRVRVGPVVP